MSTPPPAKPERYNTLFLTEKIVQEQRRARLRLLLIVGIVVLLIGGALFWASMHPSEQPATSSPSVDKAHAPAKPNKAGKTPP